MTVADPVVPIPNRLRRSVRTFNTAELIALEKLKQAQANRREKLGAHHDDFSWSIPDLPDWEDLT